MGIALALLALPPLLAAYLAVVLFALDTDKLYVQYMLVVPLVYLMASIPWGYLMLRLTQGVDIREYGSGRIGTTNVLRTAGGKAGAAVLMLDVSKGVLAILLAKAASDSAMVEVAAGLLALAGHNWSPFLGFKGGRGITPGVGGAVMVSPLATAIGLGVFAAVVGVGRYVSLGSIVGVATVAIAAVALTTVTDLSPLYLWYFIPGTALIIWQHRDNIERLLKGTERRIGQRAKKLPQAG
ncbi:MAG: glycerol-3-phosphate 1-O-acyltransferase PlsY [SAR202 cluster bacterium]|nr:glycerol-3-phosphate 1-O-acyltransferase PlsY [SAR202 cluster bacterium]